MNLCTSNSSGSRDCGSSWPVLLVFACLMALVLVGCANVESAGPAGATTSTSQVPRQSQAIASVAAIDESRLLGKNWTAVRIDGVGPLTGHAPTLRWVASNQVQGSGGCNRFAGQSSISGPELRFGALASTRMACIPEPAGQEDRFFKALESTRRWKLQGAVLQLLDREGLEILQLVGDSP